MSIRRAVVVACAGLVAAAVPALATAAEPAPAAFEDCAAPDSRSVVIGSVACQLVTSERVGGDVPVSYYVPPACAPPTGRPCAVAYLLHGFGGSYRSLLGSAAAPSAWVTALSAGPPVDVESDPEPWRYADRSLWVPRTPLPIILVAPHGRTLAGGFGPGPDIDSFWTDWNPEYAAGGRQPQYDTPAPRFEGFLLDELIPWVERTLPAIGGRSGRIVDGESLGGYGSYRLALTHPDRFASAGSISGAHNFLFAPGVDPVAVPVAGTGAPVAVAPVELPGIAPAGVPVAALPAQVQGFAAAFYALGDPATDQAYYRGNMPRDLALNARAHDADGRQLLHLRAMVNDAVPRRSQDATDASGIALETIVLPMNAEMQAAFVGQGVDSTLLLHPGLHSRPYRDPYLRDQLEHHLAALAGADRRPERFDFRSISDDFRIWGWRFQVERSVTEFLELREVGCDGFTVRGTGIVTVTVAPACRSRLHGPPVIVVDLGPSNAIDEPAGVGAIPAYGRTVHVDLG